MDNLDHLIANLLNISSNDIESILSTIDNGTTNILFLTFLLKMLSFISAFADFIV